WRTRVRPYQHIVRGTAEPHDADAASQIDTAHKCFQQEAVPSESCRRTALRVLQFLPRSFDSQNHSLHGSRFNRSRMEHRRATGFIISLMVKNVLIAAAVTIALWMLIAKDVRGSYT